MAFTARRFQGNPRLDAASNNSPPLKRGDIGEAVQILQQALIDLGFAMPRSTAKSAIPDGIFGPETEATVRAFQAANGLVQDGEPGRKTLGQLDQIFAALEAVERAKISVEANTNPPINPWYLT
ncbi:MAG TPA: peptidoglycan-binding domain-containing protein [Bryobacteraceae bacterium]|nr:peptidoglycan-binding domain-containing protein [Bryobacteraceae bacterium]